MADLSYITLPNNVTYNFKDEGARAMIPSLPLSIANGGTGAVDCEGAVGNLFNNFGYYKCIPAEDPVEDVDAYFAGFGGVYDETAPAALNIADAGVGIGCIPLTLSQALTVKDTWYTRLGGGIAGKSSSSQATASTTKSRLIVPVPETSYTSLGVASGSSTFMPAWIKWICTEYPGYSHCIFVGLIVPSGSGMAMVHIDNTSDLSGGLPASSSGIASWYANTDTTIYRFGTRSYTFSGSAMFPNRYIDMVQSVTFSAGTIGSRAQAYSWNASAIGGNPILMQVVASSGLANFMPICTISSNVAYLNIYRAISTAYSSGSITVRIWY